MVEQERRRQNESTNPIEERIESKEGFWWKIRIRLNDSYFPGWIEWALRKVGIIKDNRYDYWDSVDVTTEGDTTTIKPKE